MTRDNGARAMTRTEPGHERVRVLEELKTLLDSFPPQVRRHLVGQIQSVLVGLAR
ncbi:MAG: hypothetical protein M3P27_13145 [Acidobacteriota bacterium]|nr:hypothetical protein [Acidobacteriota bacterium]